MTRTAYMLLLLTALFWGGNAIAGKLAIGHISPMMLNSSRWLFAFAMMVAIGSARFREDWPLIRSHWLLLFLLGMFGFCIFNVALYTALTYTTAINVSVEQAGMPMLIVLLNFLFFRLKADWAQLAGLVMSIAGILLTASHGDPAKLLALDLNFGDAIMLSACIVYSAYSVWLRFKPAIHWQSLMITLTGSAALSSIPFTIAEFRLGTGIFPDTEGWLILLYVVMFPSILAQIFYIRGIELIGANRAGLFINLVPIFGTLLSLILLGEEFHPYHAVALALVFGGIGLAETSGRRKS